MLLDEAVRQVVNFPGTHGIINSSVAVCDLSKSQLTPPSILDCTALDADRRRQRQPPSSGPTTGTSAYGGQQMLGQLAASRARNNPF